MYPPVEHQVLVDLVGQYQHVVVDADLGDGPQILIGKHCAGGVVRTVDHHHGRLGGDGRMKGIVVECKTVAIGDQRDGHPLGTGHRCRGGVGVVIRLDHHHPPTGLDQPDDRSGDRLGGADRDQYLGGRIVLQAIVIELVLGHRLPQGRDAWTGRILVLAGRDGLLCRGEHRRRAVGVRESLTEIDGIVLGRQLRHLGEDGGRERL